MGVLKITRQNCVLSGEIFLPSSKSMSTRALLIGFLAPEGYCIDRLSEADDAVLMKELLLKVSSHKGSDQPLALFLKNSGAVMRFLTALLCITPGKWILKGSARLEERPLKALTEVLLTAGAEIEYLGKPGFLPIFIKGKALKGGRLHVDVTESSQFVSALMMTAPLYKNGLELVFVGEPVSIPYIRMTRMMMEMAGANIKPMNNGFVIGPGAYKAVNTTVEPDWSSASYWYEAAALSEECDILLKGLAPVSIQGDAVVAEIFEKLGVSTSFNEAGARLRKTSAICSCFEHDFTHCPDLVPAVAATIAGLSVNGRLSGCGTLKLKESDRLAALSGELGKTGCAIRIINNTELEIKAGNWTNPGILKTYGDHRMALAFSPLALKAGDISIENPSVVEKSYPGYFNDLAKVGFGLVKG